MGSNARNPARDGSVVPAEFAVHDHFGRTGRVVLDVRSGRPSPHPDRHQDEPGQRSRVRHVCPTGRRRHRFQSPRRDDLPRTVVAHLACDGARSEECERLERSEEFEARTARGEETERRAGVQLGNALSQRKFAFSCRSLLVRYSSGSFDSAFADHVSAPAIYRLMRPSRPWRTDSAFPNRRCSTRRLRTRRSRSRSPRRTLSPRPSGTLRA